MSEPVSSERKTVLVFDLFFMSFVQRVTHVQNISISVYYRGLYVLPRRMFSLFPWIWQNLLLSMEMFVQKMEGSWKKANRVCNLFFFLFYTPQLQDPLSWFLH